MDSSDQFLARPAFKPKMSLYSIVLRLLSVHNSQEMLLLPPFLSDFNSVWLV